MNRKCFIGLLSGLLGQVIFGTPYSYPKIGYIAIGNTPEGTGHGDWTVVTPDLNSFDNWAIQAVDDKKGKVWYKFYTKAADGSIYRPYGNPTFCADVKVRVVYRGTDPRYKQFCHPKFPSWQEIYYSEGLHIGRNILLS